jgi:hypothetical protein
MTLRLVLLLLVLFSSVCLEAANLVVPMAGRTALTVTSGEEAPSRVAVVFYGASNVRTIVNFTLAARESSVVSEVPDGATMARVYGPGKLTARAEGLPAVEVDALAADHVLGGLPASASVGIANPWPVAATVRLEPAVSVFVPPFEVVYVPAGRSTVRVQSSVGVYVYALTPETTIPPAGSLEAGSAPPPCSEPVSATGATLATDRWLVVMKPGAAPDFARYGIVPEAVLDDVPALLSELTAHQVAKLRCDSAVELLERP